MHPSKLICIAFCLGSLNGFAQKAENIITVKEVTRIEQSLSSDEMKGRKTYSPEIDKAAEFIADEFRAAGLQTLNSSSSYLQPFILVTAKQTSISTVLDGQEIDPKSVLVVTTTPELNIDEKSGYMISTINKGEELFSRASSFGESKLKYIVLVDSSFSRQFSRLSAIKRNMVKGPGTAIFILGVPAPKTFTIKATHDVKENKLANVVGVLPGKSKLRELVIFSGHYDHLGLLRNANGGDSIYNGANDDAAGTTAVILLAKYYAALHNNERTLVFAAFTAEEIGGFGSQYFSKQFDPASVAAMFNIEMIGTDSKWGMNSAYITGYEMTDMGEILKKNLSGTDFMFYPDPYPTEQLFYRSDNATFAKLGVPAHTISTSKMDNEPNYHKVSDEIGTLDMNNMTMIIRSIALSARTIVNGTDTPSRLKTDDLRKN